jgi:hypothetical protein
MGDSCGVDAIVKGIPPPWMIGGMPAARIADL